MKRFILEQFDDELCTSHSGLALAGFCITRFNDLICVIGCKMDIRGNVTSHADLIRSYQNQAGGCVLQGFAELKKNSSAEGLRQRLNKKARQYVEIANKCSVLTVIEKVDTKDKTVTLL